MTIEATIDAFVDGETVDTTALDAALASSDGRAYLFDVLALRQTISDAPAAAVSPARRVQTLHFYACAAVVALALVGLGYAAGVSAQMDEKTLTLANSAQSIAAPEPTRVIELKPGVNWHESKGGD